MRTYLIALGLSFLTGLVLTRLIRDLAMRWKLYTEPQGGRNVHVRPIPRLGGIAVAIATSLPLLGLVLYENKISRALAADLPLLCSLVFGGGLILAVGMVDDLKGVRARWKLLAQIGAGLIVYFSGIQIVGFTVPFLSPVMIGWLGLPITVFWMVLVINSINLIDGLDGLAGGVVTIAGGTLFVMSLIEGDALAALLLACAVGATLGFLVFNYNPASIFLGDTGSLFLGFLLGLVSIHSSQKSYAVFSIVGAFVILGLPIFDLSMAVVRRALIGQPLFSADQHHVHHLLLRKGYSQRQSVGRLLGAALVLEGFALIFVYANDKISALALIALLALVGATVHFLGYADVIKSGRRDRAMKQIHAAADARFAGVTRALEPVADARDADAIWAAICDAAEQLALDRVELDLDLGDGPVARRWERRERGDQAVHLQGVESLEIPMRLGDRELGALRVVALAEHSLFPPYERALYHMLADRISLRAAALLAGDPPGALPSEAARPGSSAPARRPSRPAGG